MPLPVAGSRECRTRDQDPRRRFGGSRLQTRVSRAPQLRHEPAQSRTTGWNVGGDSSVSQPLRPSSVPGRQDVVAANAQGNRSECRAQRKHDTDGGNSASVLDRPDDCLRRPRPGARRASRGRISSVRPGERGCAVHGRLPERARPRGDPDSGNVHILGSVLEPAANRGRRLPDDAGRATLPAALDGRAGRMDSAATLPATSNLDLTRRSTDPIISFKNSRDLKCPINSLWPSTVHIAVA